MHRDQLGVRLRVLKGEVNIILSQEFGVASALTYQSTSNAFGYHRTLQASTAWFGTAIGSVR